MKNSLAEDIRLKLTTFSGEDGYILKNSPNNLKVSFAVIGFFVMLIFIGCFTSATTFTYSLFDENPLISIPFGILWATIITIIYLLLLYTISPPTLPNKYKVKDRIIITDESNHNRFFTASMLLRLGFMTLLAIIIAQPINVYFLSKTVDPSLEKFIQLQKANMAIVADSLFVKDELKAKEDFEKVIRLKLNTQELNLVSSRLNNLNSKINLDREFIDKSYSLLDSIRKYDSKPLFVSINTKQDSLVRELNNLLHIEVQSDLSYQSDIRSTTIPNSKIEEEFTIFIKQLDKIISNKINNYDNLEVLLSKSNFYIQRIKLLLYENISSWFITCLVIIIFLYPIQLKFWVRNKRFYVKKREIEEKIVLEAYESFRIEYSQILENKIDMVNDKVFKALMVDLSKIKELNKQRYDILLKEIKEELKFEKIEFYENCENPPFRTIKRSDTTRFSSEKEFLDLLYNSTK
ncbi:DUF4407 domain-containing protein [Flavobacterium chuncheonense]|uniref:DUF4407 domain-containing protein n=1 Tax=Flavobacterium chuncheonense TaxID=2026653 RepID=A0ABW5YIT0_9FLAO